MEPCGCGVTSCYGDGRLHKIAYCPKHQAVDRLLEAAKAQHNAIDWLFDQLVEATKDRVMFYPSKSPVWAACLLGNQAITAAEGKA